MFPQPEGSAIAGLRRIRTARDELEINLVVQMGFHPLIRPVNPSPRIRTKFRIVQSKTTGEISVQSDFRHPVPPGYEVVIDWTHFYPHPWPNPYAAYLVPPDIEEGEWVVLDDLIEDLVGSVWNQGCVFRLESCRAQWINGDFVLDYDPESSTCYVQG